MLNCYHLNLSFTMKIIFMLVFKVSIINSNVHILISCFLVATREIIWHGGPWSLHMCLFWRQKPIISFLASYSCTFFESIAYPLTFTLLHITNLPQRKGWRCKMFISQKGNLIFLRTQENSMLSGMGFLATCFDVSIFKISVLFCMILPNNELCWLTVL